jgi:hypothetical protein
MLGGAGSLLYRAFSGIDVRATLHAVESAGRYAPLALAPFLVAMSLDALGSLVLLRQLGRSVGAGTMIAIRLATEALHLTAPAGFVVSDSATAALLDARGVPLADGGVLAVARKWLVMRAHGAYIVLGAMLGASLLAAISARELGGTWLPWAVGASALVPLSLSLALGAGFRGRPAIARLQALLARLPWPAVRDRVAHWQTGAVAVDGRLARIGAAPRATWTAAAIFFVCWMFESLETAVIVHLVGGPFDMGFAMAAEVGVSLLRSVGNVAPAGLGVQDAGYAVLFRALGLSTDTTAAFVLLKRGKEFVWIAIGYSLLAMLRPGGGSRRTLGRVPSSLGVFGQEQAAAPSEPAV